MTELFISVLNISISTTWLILAVLVLRILFCKGPKTYRYILWILVAIRLMGINIFVSNLSLVPSVTIIPQDIATTRVPAIESGLEYIDQTVNPIISKNFMPNPIESVNPMQIVTGVASTIWIIGLAIMLVYMLVSYIKLRKQIRESIKLNYRIRINDTIESPFILGLIFPKIYLPSNTNKEDIPYIIAHEEEHLKYHDNLWKPLGYILLAVHWFNPLVWVSYILMCRDMEIACDERVVWTLDVDKKKRYSEVLLSFAGDMKSVTACPVAFGEIGIKNRIKSIVSFKKPSGWFIVLFVVASIVITMFFATNPIDSSDVPDIGPGPSKDDVLAVDIMKAFEELYETDFIYTEETWGKEKDSTIPLIKSLKGKYDKESEIEYVVHQKGQEDWSEMYYYTMDEEDMIATCIDGQWNYMKFSRKYFSGYGQELTLDTAYKGTGYKPDLTIIDNYRTYYTIDVGAAFDLPVELEVIVHQEYGIERETGRIRTIGTEVYELQEKLIIANQMKTNDLTYDEAAEILKEIKMETELEDYISVEIEYENVDLDSMNVSYHTKIFNVEEQ